MTLDPSLAGEAYCYLTTTGRITGKPHRIEIWFALEGRTLYLLAGDGVEGDGRRRQWVRNLQANPTVSVRLGTRIYGAQARIVSAAAEDTLARRLLLAKYAPTQRDSLADWGRTALPVALDLGALN